MPTTVPKQPDLIGRKPRGSKPGVARGPYTDRRADAERRPFGLPDGWMEPDKYDTPEITSKVCRGCKFDWELSYFSPSATGRGGVKSKCKSCCSEAAIEYASTPRGKAARARAQAKFRAAYEAQEREVKARQARLEQLAKTPAGRAVLAQLAMSGALKGEPALLSLAKSFCGPMKPAISSGFERGQKS
ncbi:MAG: hypothetical protein EOO22_07470 [Comamonadaceae bacterium]|nr:MAG: hypothetical protein EOO22_07470 [Comamonadaceae bacterium]